MTGEIAPLLVVTDNGLAMESVAVAARESNGLPHGYLLFEGEQHGFRGADAIVAGAAAELFFLGQIFGFDPAGDITPVTVHNL